MSVVSELTFTMFLTVGTNTLVLGQGDQGGFALSNDEHVLETETKQSLKK